MDKYVPSDITQQLDRLVNPSIEQLLEQMIHPSQKTPEERKAIADRIKTENYKRELQLKEHAIQAAAASIGKQHSVRIGRNEVDRGVITACEFIGLRRRSKSVVAQFRIRINNLSPVVVEKLPK